MPHYEKHKSDIDTHKDKEVFIIWMQVINKIP